MGSRFCPTAVVATKRRNLPDSDHGSQCTCVQVSCPWVSLASVLRGLAWCLQGQPHGVLGASFGLCSLSLALLPA